MGLHLLLRGCKRRHTCGVGEVVEAVQIGVLLLISPACVVALLVVWRDDRNHYKHM